MNLTLADLASVPGSMLRGPSLRGSVRFRGISTDSRTLKRGDVFVALRGENFDGHRYVAAAIERGAAAIVVESSYLPGGDEHVPCLVVGNSATALGDLALRYRKKFSIPVVAVAGSNGKTTTKDMIACVLAKRFSVLSTQGNLNNHIGVPQTLFRLRPGHDVAVVEIGTNHPGELTALCRILDPTHGLVTGIGKEHLEFFGSVNGVAKEEGALFTFLGSKAGAVAFVNGDDPLVVRASRGVRRRVLYGVDARTAAVRGERGIMDASGRPQFDLRRRGVKRPTGVRLRVAGAHQVLNAVAAAAVGVHFGVPLREIVKGLESFRPASKRMEVLAFGGMTVLNDTYNANPESTVAALRTLAAAKTGGKRIAVLGDMLELGNAAPREHALVGREAARLKIDYVLTYGEYAREIHRTAGGPGAIHYEQKNMLSEYVAELAGPGDVILVKGSRGMKMEDVVTFLRERHRMDTA